MADPEPHIYLALLSWAYWSGRKELIDEITSRGERYLDLHDPETVESFLRLTACLYFPVSPDIPATTRVFHETYADRIYHLMSSKFHVSPRHFWPEGRPFALIMSHDIDRIRQTYQPAWKHLRRGRYFKGLLAIIRHMVMTRGDRDRDPYMNLQVILEQEKEWGIKSVVFVLNERRRPGQLLRLRPQHFFGIYDPKDIREGIRSLVNDGHELGFHISMDGFNRKKALTREKNYLESLWGHGIRGVRTHYLLFSRETPALLAQEGFMYDSSLGFNFQCGFRCGTSFPFLLNISGEQILWEIPLHIMDTALCGQPNGDDPGSPEPMEHIINPVIRQVTDGGGALVINWHQRNFNRSGNPALFELMESTLLTLKRKGAWVTTPEKLMRWWQTERPE